MSAAISSIKFDGVNLPSPNEAKSRFLALGDLSWMQIIDGRYHKFGPYVFDQGLHDLSKEPGFLASLKEGLRYAADSLDRRITMQFYKTLHTTLCAHFDGERTATEIGKEGIGVFRDNHSVSWKSSVFKRSEEGQFHYKTVELLKKYFHELPKDKIDPNIQEIAKKCLVLDKINGVAPEQILESLKAIFRESSAWLHKWSAEWRAKADKLGDSAAEFATKHGFDPFILIYYEKGRVYCESLEENPEKLEMIVEALFERYEKNMALYNKQLALVPKEWEDSVCQDKIREIAFLFQHLEWLHPFQDGQGRTDLVLLSKLLTEQGFSPAILDRPYMSSYSTLEEWVDYLKIGMKRWQDQLETHSMPKNVQSMKDE